MHAPRLLRDHWPPNAPSQGVTAFSGLILIGLNAEK
jgi:hypothetical protein